MADHRLRSLERDLATGDPGARARLLRERLRAGTLELERAQLAAWLGDPDAREALGPGGYEAFAAPLREVTRRVVGDLQTESASVSLAIWVAALERWGAPACVRAAIAAARLALPTIEGKAYLGPAARSAARDALRAAEAWARCPCDAHAEAGHGAWSDAVWEATSSASPDPHGARNAAVRVARWAGGETSVDAVRDAVRAELVPWALGLGEPLA